MLIKLLIAVLGSAVPNNFGGIGKSNPEAVKLVEEVVYDFWVKQVFRQHPDQQQTPSPPAGYEYFVSGQHPQIEEIRKHIEE